MLLANELNLALYRVEFSQAVSEYVGETEKTSVRSSIPRAGASRSCCSTRQMHGDQPDLSGPLNGQKSHHPAGSRQIALLSISSSTAFKTRFQIAHPSESPASRHLSACWAAKIDASPPCRWMSKLPESTFETCSCGSHGELPQESQALLSSRA